MRDNQTDLVGPNKQEVYSKAAPKRYKQDQSKTSQNKIGISSIREHITAPDRTWQDQQVNGVGPDRSRQEQTGNPEGPNLRQQDSADRWK
jgi:hypothetical protein